MSSKSKQQTSKSRWDDLPGDLQNVIIQLSNVPALVNRRLDQKEEFYTRMAQDTTMKKGIFRG